MEIQKQGENNQQIEDSSEEKLDSLQEQCNQQLNKTSSQQQQKLNFEISVDRKNCHIDQIHSIQKIQLLHEVETTHEEDIYCITIIDDHFLVTGSIDQYMHVYLLATYEKLYSLPGMGEAIQCLEAFRTSNQKRSFLLSSSFDQSILVYDLYQEPPIMLIRLEGIGTELTIMLDLKDQEYILGGTIAGHIGVWSMKYLKPMTIVINAHQQQVSCLKIINYQQKEFLSCSSDGSISMWRLEKIEDRSLIGQNEKNNQPNISKLCTWKENHQILSINVIDRPKIEPAIIMGTHDGQMIIKSLTEKYEQIDQSLQHNGEVNEILILQDMQREKVFTLSTSHQDRFILLNDLMKAKQKKIKNENIYCFYFNVNSKMQFFRMKGDRLGLAVVCQEQLNPMFLIFEILIK